MMIEKLLKIESNKWFLLTDRPDKETVISTIKHLIEIGYKFHFSECMSKFYRQGNDLFEWAASYPAVSEIKEKKLNGRKVYELYHEGRLIAIK